MAEIGMGTLYDMNKSAVRAQGPLNRPKFQNGIKLIKEYFENTKNIYYMMLCHENRDYTVFRISSLDKCKEAADIAKECIENRGKCYSIDKDENNAIEIWIEDEDDLKVYYLFPYDAAIIEV